MKVGIVTIVDMINYGNRLQNYAMQQILKDLGVQDVDTIVAISAKRQLKNIVKNVMRIANCEYLYKKRPYLRREKPFEKFTSENIKQKKIVTMNGKIPEKLASQYDYFILGSDQIWNPEFINEDVSNGGVYNRFLQFANDEQKIAVSPSFGVSQITNDWGESIKGYLLNFAALSSREEAGANIIETLTGRETQVLFDPTMILEAEQWRKFEAKINIDISKPYILKYVLGIQSEQYQREINKIAEERRYVVYDMLSSENSALQAASPDQFLTLIDNASLICTDSFHATVFSILFNKPFLLHKRDDTLKSMNSRLETLLSTLRLEYKLNPNDANQFDCDYSVAHNIIRNERKKFLAYLKNALEHN